MNETTLFKNDKFGEIRNVMEGATPWFVANDVAKALGYKDPAKAVSTIVDKRYRSVTKMVTVDGKKIKGSLKWRPLLEYKTWSY